MVRHAPALVTARSDLADAAALSAARCAGCCHRRVSSCALNLLAALLAAANVSSSSGSGGGGAPIESAAAGAGRGGGMAAGPVPEAAGGASAAAGARGAQPLQAVLGRRGTELTQGLLSALLAPSPLPRVHKVAALLLDLSNLAALLESRDRQTDGRQAQVWLAATLQALPAGALAPGEAQAVLQEWGPLLAQHSSRSYVSLRRFRRIVREFAEVHSRKQQ